ncbi:hypothetical protein [Streptomyces sp. BPTC-684]|uniref:hypothetical protein n=1 Tax=Streptomyces sp. BPTC-684 TaxID=3043734 RepID=UPI0024B0B0C3|nr:hypothetical protein [Streptomyces sp. BPTC-684]WHM38807.1 hypothetical protein QIY60_19070 [Streptomyces sp. BPTC-684]
MSARPRAAWPLVAVFTAGYLAAYLLPTVVGRLSSGLGLSPTQAGLIGSTLLLSSAAAGFATAGALYLTIPRLGGGHGVPFAAIGMVAGLAWPATTRLPGPAPVHATGRGEILWNVFYPVVLSYLLALAASLDPRGRWAVLALGVACGPLTGSVLSSAAGFGGMGAVLGALLLAVAAPLTLLASRPRRARVVRPGGGEFGLSV